MITLGEWYEQLKKIAGEKVYLIDHKEEYEELYKMGKTPEEVFRCELNRRRFF